MCGRPVSSRAAATPLRAAQGIRTELSRRGRGTPGIVSRLIATAAGVTAAICFEPFGLGLLSPVAMALLWLSLQRQSLRGACASGIGFGLAFMLPLLWWLEASIGFAAWIALGLAQALILMVAAVGIWVVAKLPAAPLWGAPVWVGVETVRSNWPLGGLPWGQLGFSAVDTPWASLLPYLGISGTSLFLATTGFALAHACSRPTRCAVAMLVVPAMAALLAFLMPVQLPADETANVAAVQGGVPGDGTDLIAHHREVTRNHVQQTVRLGEALRREDRSVDLVVWPENATAVDPFADPIANAGILRAARAVEAPLLVGGIVDGPDQRTAYNRGILWLPNGSPVAHYTKTHPVPFGEYIPWRSVIGDWFARFDEIPRDMLAGTREGPLDVNGLMVADAICFDVAYDDVLPDQVRRGARLAVVQTSNATFTGTAQPAQQFEITRARAIELGRSVVVASTNGISGIIDASGTVQQQTTTRDSATLLATVDLHSQLTPAVLLQGKRNLAIGVGATIGLGWAAALTVRRRRRQDV